MGGPAEREPAEPVADPSGARGPALPRISVWQRLAGRVPIRLDPGRRAAVAVGLAVLVAALATGWWVLAERPRALAVSASPAAIPGASSPVGTRVPSGPRPGASTPAGSTPAGSTLTATAPVVVVDVAGKVRRPGLYRLRTGSRVDDAVRAAGGALAGVDLSRLNLAAKVVDGQQILVGVAPPAGAAPPAAPGGGPTATAGPLDLNSASLDQLETLPGVGPVLAQHILDWRTAHGGFRSTDQLNDVPGIGDVKFAALQPLVTA